MVAYLYLRLRFRGSPPVDLGLFHNWLELAKWKHALEKRANTVTSS